MFTGIIEETGSILSFAEGDKIWRLTVSSDLALKDAELGDSIAVNGCCLTIVEIGETSLSFDVLAESKRLTTLDELGPGGWVNLERAVRLDGKMGGHFVTGHIDGMGTILELESQSGDTFIRVSTPEGMGRYIVPKGSIAIDGISLTVAEVRGDTFGVWIIPHTLKQTNLGSKLIGHGVNLEFDQLGKYVEKMVARLLT